jgi:AcrR family transcriptional regulator
MEEKKLDRRIQRTRHSLQEALISLILEKGYASVTVQDILDRANMGRSTFYAHFRDKEDLLLSGFDHLLKDFEKEYPTFSFQENGEKAGKELSLFIFRHTQSNLNLFKAMIGGQGGDVIEKNVHKFLSQIVRQFVTTHVPEDQLTIPLEILVLYIVKSYMALLIWWLDHDTPYPPEDMDVIAQQLIAPGIKAVLVLKN